MTETMPAWTRETYGPAAGTTRTRQPVPQPHRGEVVLRVQATALNAGDVRLLLGDPLLVRPFFGLTRPKHPVRGLDVAGTVVAVGADVVNAELGELVVGELQGGGGLAS
ncbi:NAD(P)-dependent alcohol dehydrogenase, partial [Microbacterium sp. HSID17254]